ncbi:MAG: hypothetical protein Q8O59_04670, partial [bacterium]|nr:hypothetical protein [bacterium]
LSGTQISFHSPIELNVYDENNNHVGPDVNGDIELGIAGARYDNIDGNKFVFLPAGHNYRVVGRATDSGTFNARVQNIENGQYTQTIYYNEVPLNNAGAAVKLQIINGQLTGSMEIDQNSDQVFETKVELSAVLNQAEAADLIKPETQISLSGSLGDNDVYTSIVTATLIATDNQGGSGILKIQYSLDNGLTWQNYNSPISLNDSGEYSILYKATDRAGNIETEKAQTLKINKPAPIINIIPPAVTINGSVIIIGERAVATPANASLTASSTPAIEPEVELIVKPLILPKVLGVKYYADNTLIRGKDKKIYLIQNNRLVVIRTLTQLRKYQGQEICDVSDPVIRQYLEFFNGQLIRGSNKRIYVITNGKKQPIFTLIELKKYLGREINNVSDQILGQY